MSTLAAACLLIDSAAAGQRYVAAYGQSDAALASVLNASGTVVANYPQIRLLIAESDDANFSAGLSKNGNFRYVVADQDVQWLGGVRASAEQAMPSLPEPQAAFAPVSPFAAFFLASQQWNIFQTQTNLAWGVTIGSAAVKVAVLDTGICAHHLDTFGKVDAAQSASFVTELPGCAPAVFPPCVGCPAWEDRHWHGTHVASTISSNNHGTAGVAPNVRLRAVKVLRCDGVGPFSAAIMGIIHAVDTGNDVINMSLGAHFLKSGDTPGPGSLGLLVAAVNAAVNYAERQGVLVVSAAGDGGLDLDADMDGMDAPCQSGSGICVGSTTRSGALSSFSSHGVSGPNLMAPGGGLPVAPFPATTTNLFILAPCSRHSVAFPICGFFPFTHLYLSAAGTSMATPQVSGAAALADSIAPGGPGTKRAGQLRNDLLKGADDLGKTGVDNTYSHGRLNTLGAVSP